MVDWPTFVGVVFEVLEERDVEVGFDAGGEVMQAASVLWNEDKGKLKASTRQEAKAHAEANIRVT